MTIKDHLFNFVIFRLWLYLSLNVTCKGEDYENICLSCLPNIEQEVEQTGRVGVLQINEVFDDTTGGLTVKTAKDRFDVLTGRNIESTSIN